MLNSLKNRISFFLNKKKWRRKNSHNNTFMGTRFKIDSVKVGRYSYGLLNVIDYSGESKLIIGDFCSIATDVTFVLNGDHYIDHISSFPFKKNCLHSVSEEAITHGNIIIDDDVWICQGATILSGVHIHQGAIIAAGALVTKDVEPYVIVGGIPAKTIRKRFPDDIINELCKVDFKKLSKEAIENHIEDLYEEVVGLNQLEWLPRK